ncbi:uncharacterized protein LOC111102567 isoform X1 [Crassostrea virginica]
MLYLKDFRHRVLSALNIASNDGYCTSPESKHEMQVEVNCDTCENTAKHLCKACHDRLCDGCKIIHSKSKASCDHDVVLLTFEELTLTSDCSLECPPYQDCKWHPTFKANVACKKCKVPVCEKCLIGNHNGHSLKDINEMFKDKKEKLEQKVSMFRSELPKYESNLEEVKRNQEKILENRDAVKKEIVSHFEKVISTLEASKEMLLSSADNMAQTSINALANHQQKLQSYIQNMHELANNVENEDLRKRKAFIFYENCSASCLGEPLSFPSPGMLKYSKTIICKQSEQFLGRVSQNIKLRETKIVRVVSVLSCEEPIGALVYSSKSGAFWLSSFKTKSYSNVNFSEEGRCIVIDELKVKELNSRSNFLGRCIVVHNDTIFYMKDCHKLFTREESQKNLLIDFAPMVVVCLSLTKDGELLVILQNSGGKHSGIARFNLKGKCKQYLTHIVKKRTAEPILPDEYDVRAYIAENINGDICLSVYSENRKAAAVIIMRPNGVHRVTYEGQQSSEAQYVRSWDSLGFSLFRSFRPRGICTNVNGHILVADVSNRGIHVLHEDGGFLKMLTLPNEPRVIPISLCVDNQNNLCIGCADGKIRILQYLD